MRTQKEFRDTVCKVQPAAKLASLNGHCLTFYVQKCPIPLADLRVGAYMEEGDPPVLWKPGQHLRFYQV